jgi:hypothetical protein
MILARSRLSSIAILNRHGANVGDHPYLQGIGVSDRSGTTCRSGAVHSGRPPEDAAYQAPTVAGNTCFSSINDIRCHYKSRLWTRMPHTGTFRELILRNWNFLKAVPAHK